MGQVNLHQTVLAYCPHCTNHIRLFAWNLLENAEDSGPANSSDFPLADDESIPNDDLEERARLISQILELQNTLEDLSQRFDSVKDECFKLRSENQVLSQYIKNLMSSSSMFQPTAHTNKSATSNGAAEILFDDHCW
uniref:Short coiled-coil protein n=1 Tax=Ditylenchus dipsaci TaxID=166011 RepID=A0A915DZI8_9BILA